MKAVTVIGIGDDGCKGLTSRALDAVARAQWLAGGERHLQFFPQFDGERLVIKGEIAATIERIAALAEEHDVCVVASGDPLFFGIGAAIVARVGAEHVEVVPHPSSVQWAFARAGLSWDDATLLSLHGRSGDGLVQRMRRSAKVALLTDRHNTPAAIARHLLENGETGWHAIACENLCAPGERVRRFALAELARTEDIGPLVVLVLQRADGSWREPEAIPFHHEDAFARRMPKNGLITKREIRLLSLAQLAIRPDAVVWDIGAGSGSVAIEAALLAPRGRVYAVEVDPEGVEICRDNARTHGADNVRVVAGRAPEALAELESPDAVFVGGSKGSMADIVAVALERLRPGGRLVVNAITLENAGEAYQTLRGHGLTPEVTLVQISRGVPLARYLRYEACNPIQIFAVQKPVQPPAQASAP
jgi:precorrin-6B C5,15-methyltransferase / cobalt-precorrin-6B C5,C15-methyltransferase